MAEATATPPIDMAALTKAIGELVVTEVTKANKAMNESLATIGTQLAELKKAPETKKEETPTFEKMKTDLLSEVKNLLTSQKQTESQEKARSAFIAEKMKDLRPAYQNQLGSDPTKWAAEEQAIRAQFKEDFKGLGGKVEDKGGGGGGGEAPATKVDLSKMSPTQLITLGLNEKPAEAAAAK